MSVLTNDLSAHGLCGALQPRKGGSTVVLEPVGVRVTIDGGREWILAGSAALRARVQEAVGRHAEVIGDRLVLSFGNAVGRFRVPGVGELDVETQKIGAKAFQAMLAKLTAVAAALPFAARPTAALPFERTHLAHRDLVYHAFVYLRHAILEADLAAEAGTGWSLTDALEAIVRDPHARLDREPVLTDAGLARSVDSRSVFDLLTRPGALERAPNHRGRLAVALRGHLPRTILERRATVVYDTPENRFVRAFLDQCLDVVATMRRLVEEGQFDEAYAPRLRTECDQIEAHLRPIRRASLWDGVSAMTYLPAGSTVLQRRWPYRETFRHYTRLMLGSRMPLDDREVQALLEAKDAAALYELWCYFEVVDALATVIGRRADAAEAMKRSATQVSVPWHYQVSWRARAGWPTVRVVYNASFSGAKENPRRSSSVPLRPDILIEVERTGVLDRYVFDAKFRVRFDPPAPGNATGNKEDATAASEVGRNVPDTYATAHTYRDALKGVRGVWILYPGTDPPQFYPAHDAPEGSRLDGVGELPLRPDVADYRNGLLEKVRVIVSQSNGSGARSSEMLMPGAGIGRT